MTPTSREKRTTFNHAASWPRLGSNSARWAQKTRRLHASACVHSAPDISRGNVARERRSSFGLASGKELAIGKKFTGRLYRLDFENASGLESEPEPNGATRFGCASSFQARQLKTRLIRLKRETIQVTRKAFQPKQDNHLVAFGHVSLARAWFQCHADQAKAILKDELAAAITLLSGTRPTR